MTYDSFWWVEAGRAVAPNDARRGRAGPFQLSWPSGSCLRSTPGHAGWVKGRAGRHDLEAVGARPRVERSMTRFGVNTRHGDAADRASGDASCRGWSASCAAGSSHVGRDIAG